jgi:murein hydrolase activator
MHSKSDADIFREKVIAEILQREADEEAARQATLQAQAKAAAELKRQQEADRQAAAERGKRYVEGKRDERLIQTHMRLTGATKEQAESLLPELRAQEAQRDAEAATKAALIRNHSIMSYRD